ncbi:MAG: hypothetical protein JO286_26435 [Solirubrobacterales bacterium]|nr:hypothetical protein [Solirubrobacterales bacterium]
MAAVLVTREVDVLVLLVRPHAATAQATAKDINVLTRLRAISRGER